MEFGNDFARNVIIFCVDKSLSFHSDNLKNIFSMSGEGQTYDINGSFGSAESLELTFVNQRQNFASVYIMMKVIVICLLLEKKSISLKAIVGMSAFQLSFV